MILFEQFVLIGYHFKLKPLNLCIGNLFDVHVVIKAVKADASFG